MAVQVPVVHRQARLQAKLKRARRGMPGFVAVVSAMLVLGGAAQAATAATAHPLSGKIWDVRQQHFITEPELLRRLAATDFVLLGEVHDNPEQHAGQASVVRSLVQMGRRPALAMEQFDRENQSAIDAAIAAGADADAIATAGRLDRKGWRWQDYEPLVRVAVSSRLPVAAANLSRPAAREVAARGFDRLDVAPASLAVEEAWNGARDATLAQTIVESHCGQLRPEDTGPMTRAQRARDAVMADVLLRHRANGAVLIAGNGHVRRDLAVPLYVRARAPAASIVAVAFTEVQAGENDIAAYDIPRVAGSTEPAFDYLWFTGRAAREDPCAGFALPQGTSRAPTNSAGTPTPPAANSAR